MQVNDNNLLFLIDAFNCKTHCVHTNTNTFLNLKKDVAHKISKLRL